MDHVITYRIFMKLIFSDDGFIFLDFKFSYFLLKVKGKSWENISLKVGKISI